VNADAKTMADFEKRVSEYSALHRKLDTALPEPDDICPLDQEVKLSDQTSLTVTDRSIVVLIGK